MFNTVTEYKTPGWLVGCFWWFPYCV